MLTPSAGAVDAGRDVDAIQEALSPPDVNAAKIRRQVDQEAAPVPANLPKLVRQEIGRWADHPFQHLPAVQYDSARWEGSGGYKEWINVIYRAGPYAVLKSHSTDAREQEMDYLGGKLGMQRLSAVWSTNAGNSSRRTLGFSDIKPLRPSPTVKPIGDVRPQDLSVEYNWDIRIGSEERNLHETWRVTGVTDARVTVNGIDYRLPAFDVAHVSEQQYVTWRRVSTIKYVPVLGAQVETKTFGQNATLGRLTDVRVSEEVLSRVRAAAL